MPRKLRSLYICYLTLTDPLVQTQVVAYLDGLAKRGHTIHLLTFEPKLGPDRRRVLAAELQRRGIVWHSLRYHKRPTLPATIFDALWGAAVATWLVRRHRLQAIHARSHVPAATGMIVRRLTGCRLIFDIRGLLAEEYVDGGQWRRGSLPYRITNRMQQAGIRRADGHVMLTETVRRYLFGANPPESTHVIPCCADLRLIDAERSGAAQVRAELGIGDRPAMVYVGKFSGRYLAQEMVAFFAAARRADPDLLFLVLTQTDRGEILAELEREAIPTSDYRVTRAEPGELGRYLAVASFGICFLEPCLSEIAASPTKIGEYLGAGLPVVATAGIGDVDALLPERGVGVIVESLTPRGYDSASERVRALTSDPESGERCRTVAREHYSLEEVGVPRYDALYRQIAGINR